MHINIYVSIYVLYVYILCTYFFENRIKFSEIGIDRDSKMARNSVNGPTYRERAHLVMKINVMKLT